MRTFWKIGITCLMLIVCALVVIPASAEDVSVLSEQQASMYQGQNSQVYQVTLNCPGTATVTSSYGARFDLYAKKTNTYGSCPSADSIVYGYTKVAYGYSGTASMTLEAGTWCLVVKCYSGSGSYNLRVTSNCPYPTPYPTQYPTPYPTQCGVYKTDTRQGYLNQGQAAVYGYSIPSDGRSKIEWSMTSSGSCSGGTPIIVASTGSSVESSSCSGSSTFDMYVFKDCNPQYSYCNTNYYSYGPNSYVSIAPPATGSTYYVMVYARSGSGNYNLKMNSYKCSGTPIIVASAGMDAAVSTASSSEDTGSGSSIAAPTAEFVTTQ